MSYKKTKVNLPGQPYYRYDVRFKRKVLEDIKAGLISERKAAKLFNFNRKNLTTWRLELSEDLVKGSGEMKKVTAPVDYSVIASMAAIHQENKLLKEQLAHARLHAEALQTIMEVAELDLGISLKKSLRHSGRKDETATFRYSSSQHLSSFRKDPTNILLPLAIPVSDQGNVFNRDKKSEVNT